MNGEDLTCVSFKDTAFLRMFGLSEANALDYFAQSQFYDPLCINEQLKMQARFNELNAQQLDITTMKGVEFSLWYGLLIFKMSFQTSTWENELKG